MGSGDPALVACLTCPSTSLPTHRRSLQSLARVDGGAGPYFNSQITGSARTDGPCASHPRGPNKQGSGSPGQAESPPCGHLTCRWARAPGAAKALVAHRRRRPALRRQRPSLPVPRPAVPQNPARPPASPRLQCGYHFCKMGAHPRVPPRPADWAAA